MKNTCIIFYCVFQLSIVGCSVDKKDNSLLPTINIEQNIKNFTPLNLSSFVSDINYIALDSEPIILSRINQVDFHQNLIAVRGRDHCLLYDTKGRFKAKIGNTGRGPGEYLYSINIEIGSDNKIYIQGPREINVFDLNGKFIKTFEPEVNTDNNVVVGWSLLNDSLIIGSIPNNAGDEKYKAIIFNTRGKTIQAFPNWTFLNKATISTSIQEKIPNIHQFNGETYFKERMNDTLFLISNELSLEPVYYFNLGKYGEPIENQELGFMSERWKSWENFVYIENIYESRHNLFIDCFFGIHTPVLREIHVPMYDTYSYAYTTLILGVYDKATEDLVFAQPYPIDNHFLNTGLKNDIDGGINFYPKAMVNDSTLAMWIDAYIIKNHVASKAFKNSTPKNPEKKKELEELAASLDENDNPVLMLVKLKE